MACPITTRTSSHMWRESDPPTCSERVWQPILEKPRRRELCDENSDEFGASHSVELSDLRRFGAERGTASAHRKSHSRSAERYGAASAPGLRQLRPAAGRG